MSQVKPFACPHPGCRRKYRGPQALGRHRRLVHGIPGSSRNSIVGRRERERLGPLNRFRTFTAICARLDALEAHAGMAAPA